MPIEMKTQFSQFLQNVAESLDIPETHYKEAEERYKAVGKWLGKEDSPLSPYKPEIYPQGSFRLGTAIKPISEADEYDIDLVCELTLGKDEVSQKTLKQMVGDRLKSNDTYARILDKKEGRRCWTLVYADSAQFHMDILPAIPNRESFKRFLLEKTGSTNEWADSTIAITDKEHYNYDSIDDDWLSSNPKGYAEWFKSRMEIRFLEVRTLVAKSLSASIENVPDYKVKTPLQRVIQILKRHRDMFFKDESKLKPGSIIITTLAAHAYENEADLLEALQNIVNGMEEQLESSTDGVAEVLNPVNPTENFADKWKDEPRLETSCRVWLKKVREDINRVMEEDNIRMVGAALKDSFGERVVKEAASGIAATTGFHTIITQSRPKVEITEPVKPWGEDGK